MCLCLKNHLVAVFESAFGLWRPLTYHMATLKNESNISHVLIYKKKYLETVFEAAFGIWRPSIWKWVRRPEKPMKRHITWLYFETDIFIQFLWLLAAFTIFGRLPYSKPLEDGRYGFSHSKTLKMTYHICLYPKNHLKIVSLASDLKKMSHFCS